MAILRNGLRAIQRGTRVFSSVFRQTLNDNFEQMVPWDGFEAGPGIRLEKEPGHIRIWTHDGEGVGDSAAGGGGTDIPPPPPPPTVPPDTPQFWIYIDGEWRWMDLCDLIKTLPASDGEAERLVGHSSGGACFRYSGKDCGTAGS